MDFRSGSHDDIVKFVPIAREREVSKLFFGRTREFGSFPELYLILSSTPP